VHVTIAREAITTRRLSSVTSRKQTKPTPTPTKAAAPTRSPRPQADLPDDQLFDEDRAARFLDVSSRTLRNWRKGCSRGFDPRTGEARSREPKGPRVVYVGIRPRYRLCDLRAFVNVRDQLTLRQAR
jgi:hypothetical protein